MNLRKTVKGLSVVGLAAAVSIASMTASAGPRVKWKMQSAFGSTLVHLGPGGLRFAERIKTMSEGKFQVKFFEPGALVPALECFDAISKGSIESCWTTPGYHAGKIPAIQFFTTVPFGPQMGEFLAWKIHAGGNALRDEIYAKHNLKSIDSMCIGPETSGWFKKPINSLEELKGMKMRFFGLGASVMQKMGVSTQLLAGADIYPALERGVIDATEFSMPTIDIKLGFYQIAKNNYFPGWHQQVSCGEFLTNMEVYNKLPGAYKAMIDAAALAEVVTIWSETEAQNPAAMIQMSTKHGVVRHRWPDNVLAKLEKAWFEVLAEKSADDALFKQVADHYLAFRAEYKPWADAQHLKSTYRE